MALVVGRMYLVHLNKYRSKYPQLFVDGKFIPGDINRIIAQIVEEIDDGHRSYTEYECFSFPE